MLKITNQKRFKIAIIVSGSFFYLSGLIFYFNYQISNPLTESSQEQIFTIESGRGLREIANNLDEAQLIRNKTLFVAYALYKGWAAQLKAGDYALSPNLTIGQIVRKIVAGEVISQDITITIPEGFTLKQIDARLAEAGLIESGQLLAKPELEGYLFPDTYQFNRKADLDEMIVEMRDNFDRKLDQELVVEIRRQGKTIRQIVIMASLLEKEVPLYSDMRIVSGIFWKRIENDYPLQSCATIAYILGINKWIYSTEDTEIDSLYNTYQNAGLPPGPICNPGLLAIKAAIYPVDTDYYFFLSTPDGQTIFSRTFKEHQANKEKYLR
ncbi:MAG: endolytic transglycosylase MltG [Patescibacteria group bacterium]